MRCHRMAQHTPTHTPPAQIIPMEKGLQTCNHLFVKLSVMVQYLKTVSIWQEQPASEEDIYYIFRLYQCYITQFQK